MRFAPTLLPNMSSTANRRVLAALQLLLLLSVPVGALADQRLRRPPDVDLDPDRGMPFDRLPKSAFQHRELDTMRKLLASKVMDPAVEPYQTIVKPSKYEPYTGQIRGSINDHLRDMRHDADVSRKFAGSKTAVPSPFAPKPPPNLLAGMPRPDRLLRSPVVDPIVALRKQQENDQKDDSDDD
jgi:hypothetical protein